MADINRVPDLSQAAKKKRVGVNFAAIPLHIGPNGLVVDMMPANENPPRELYWDGQQFLDEIESTVRKAIRAELVRSGLVKADDDPPS